MFINLDVPVRCTAIDVMLVFPNMQTYPTATSSNTPKIIKLIEMEKLTLTSIFNLVLLSSMWYDLLPKTFDTFVLF